MKRLYLLIILLVAFVSSLTRSSTEMKCDVRKPLMWDIGYLEEIRDSLKYQKLRESIIQKADTFLTREPIDVTQKEASKIGVDAHSYYSIGIYWWPDEEDRTKPYVWKDGRINPEYKEYDYFKLMEIVDRCKNLSVAYFLTEDRKYYDKLLEQIEVWFLNPSTNMTPNFEYAQVVPGYYDGNGRPEGISEARFLIPVFESLLLVNHVNPIDESKMALIKEWCKELAVWLVSSEKGLKARLSKDNHVFMYDALLVYLSAFSGHIELSEWVLSSFSDQLKSHINDKGQYEKELLRTQAYAYSIVCLTEIINVCLVEEKIGNNLFEGNKNIITPTIEYLAQFIGNKEKFPYTQIYDWHYYEQELLYQIKRLNNLKGGERIYDSYRHYELSKCYKELMLQ